EQRLPIESGAAKRLKPAGDGRQLAGQGVIFGNACDRLHRGSIGARRKGPITRCRDCDFPRPGGAPGSHSLCTGRIPEYSGGMIGSFVESFFGGAMRAVSRAVLFSVSFNWALPASAAEPPGDLYQIGIALNQAGMRGGWVLVGQPGAWKQVRAGAILNDHLY